jgi:hypothetical protein
MGNKTIHIKNQVKEIHPPSSPPQMGKIFILVPVGEKWEKGGGLQFKQYSDVSFLRESSTVEEGLAMPAWNGCCGPAIMGAILNTWRASENRRHFEHVENFRNGHHFDHVENFRNGRQFEHVENFRRHFEHVEKLSESELYY